MTSTFKENKEFQAKRELWNKLKDLSEGDPSIMRSSEYLIPHELEEGKNVKSEKLREIRQKRSIYTNYLEPFTRRFVNLIFKNAIDFSLAKDVIFTGASESDFYDIDGFGNNLETFIKEQIAYNYILYGKTAIYVDSYPSSAQTRLDEQLQGLRPFMESWEPLSVIDWKRSEVTSELNGLDFAVRRYKYITPRYSAKDEEKIVNAYRHIYLDPISGHYSIEEYIEDGKGSVYHVPEPAIEFLPLSIKESKSSLKEGAEKAVQIYNLESVLDNILLFQAHQRLFAVGNFSDNGGSFAAGEGNLTILRGEGSITSIEPVNTASLESRIAQIKASMFQLVFHQTRQIAADSKAVESVETIKEAKEEFRAIAQSHAHDLQQVVNQALWHYGVFQGNQNLALADFIKIDTNISENDVEQFALWMNSFGDRIRRYPKWQKAIDKKAASLMNLANMDEVLEEIEAGIAEQPDPIRDLFNVQAQNTEPDQEQDNEPDQGEGVTD